MKNAYEHKISAEELVRDMRENARRLAFQIENAERLLSKKQFELARLEAILTLLGASTIGDYTPNVKPRVVRD